MNATVTISLSEWQAQIDALRSAEQEIVSLKKDLIEARCSDPSDRVPRLIRGMRAAARLIPLAMQCGARAWPYEALIDFATVLESMPDVDVNDVVMAIDMRKFADNQEAIRLPDPRPMA